MTEAIFKGDDTAAFGGNFLKITIKNPKLKKVSKVVVKIMPCCIQKNLTDTDFFQREETVLFVNLNSSDTSKLNNGANIIYLIPYDELGRQRTCNQTRTFYSRNGVICNGR